MSKHLSLLAVLFSLLALTSVAASDTDMEWQGALRSNHGAVAQKLLMWLNVTDTNQPTDTNDLIRFTRENSGWPKLYEFRDRIEHSIGALSHPSEIAAWFDQNPPKTEDGIKDYIAALIHLGHNNKARTALRKFWTSAELDRKETAILSSQFKKLFSPTDHIDRVDNLLWQQRYQESEYMIPLVDSNHDKLVQARIALGRMSSKVTKLVHAVPATLQNDSGLLYDRLKWRRQMNKDADAVDLLHHAPKNQAHADLWWRERNILARRAIEKKHFSDAYKIIADHHMTSGADYSQAEWTLGWLSLRFLHQPDAAYRHFDNFYQAVTSAVSRSRAAYWLARAAAAMHQQESASNWYKLGTEFPSTFYGQLCAEQINGSIDATQFEDDQVSSEEQQNFDDMELVQVIRLLYHIDQMKYANTFFIKLLDRAKERPDFVLIAKLARETKQLHFSVEANKQLQQKLGDFMFTEGYPLMPALPVNKPERALIHAIVHRESMFDSTAASSAGARGLMQLMPGTAKHISRSMGKRFTIGKLTNNPQYNIELGASYLQHLLNSYDGFYPLAIAAYNAGPSNVDQWIKEFGDPRKRKVDIIDWIEEIPIYETRNYVQRVMESYYLYKLKLSEQPRTVLAFGRG
ncbi:MAG: lytic transglycosylase domain-containing protein [Proteobacteria bacterium]|nr:lytic transglycosylase domain-containing protein [Pseudomonadota bacterium]